MKLSISAMYLGTAIAFCLNVVVGAHAQQPGRISFVSPHPDKAIRDTPINIGGWIVSQVSPSLPVSIQVSANHGVFQIGNAPRGSLSTLGEDTSTLIIRATASAANAALIRPESIRFKPAHGFTGMERITIKVYSDVSSSHTLVSTLHYDLQVFTAPLEAWLKDYFGTDATNPTAERTRGYADPDGDSKTNRLEYATGEHPLMGSVNVAPMRVVPPTSSDGPMEVVFSQRADDTQMKCSLHHSFDLTNWVVLELTEQNCHDDDAVNGIVVRHVIIPGPLRTLPQFYRLAIDSKNWLPQIRVTSVEHVDDQLSVNWVDQDEDSNARLSIILEPATSPRDWLIIASDIDEDADGLSDSIALSTLPISSGDYAVLVVADDGINPPSIARWSGSISITRDGTDTDGNGIPDYWQNHYLSTSRNSDVDRDGFADGLEFLVGTSPLAPNGLGEGQIALASRVGLGASSDHLYLESARSGYRRASKLTLNLDPALAWPPFPAVGGMPSQVAVNNGSSIGVGLSDGGFSAGNVQQPSIDRSLAILDANRDGFADGLPLMPLLSAAATSATTLNYPNALGLNTTQAKLPGDGLVLLTALGQLRIARVSNLNLLPEHGRSPQFGGLGVLLPDANTSPKPRAEDSGRTAPGWAVGSLSQSNLPTEQIDFDGDGLSFQLERSLGLSFSDIDNVESLVLDPQMMNRITSNEQDVLALSSAKAGTRLAKRTTLNIRGQHTPAWATLSTSTGGLGAGVSSGNGGASSALDHGLHVTDLKGALDLKYGIVGDVDRNGFAVFTDALVLGKTSDASGLNVTMAGATQRAAQYGEPTDLLLVSSTGRWHLANKATLNLQPIPTYSIGSQPLSITSSSLSRNGSVPAISGPVSKANAAGFTYSSLFDANHTSYSHLVMYLMGGAVPTAGNLPLDLSTANPALAALLSAQVTPSSSDVLALVSARDCVWLADKQTLDIRGSIGVSRRSPMTLFTSPELAIYNRFSEAIGESLSPNVKLNPESADQPRQAPTTPLVGITDGSKDANRNGFADVLDTLFLNRMNPLPDDNIANNLAVQTAAFAASRITGSGVMLTDVTSRIALADYAALNLRPSKTTVASESFALTSILVPQGNVSSSNSPSPSYPTAPGWRIGSAAGNPIAPLAADDDRDGFAQAIELYFRSSSSTAGIMSATDAQAFPTLTARINSYATARDGVVLPSVTGNLYFADTAKLNLSIILGAKPRAGLSDAAIAYIQTAQGIIPLGFNSSLNHSTASSSFIANGNPLPPILSTANYQDADRDGLSDSVELAAQFDNSTYTNMLTALLPTDFVQSYSNAIPGLGLLLVTPEQSYSFARYPDLNLLTPIQPLVTSNP